MSIYCYVSPNKYYSNDETLILGFMSSLNHQWDNECFYTIYCRSSTEKSFHDKIYKIDKIDESLKDFNIHLLNGDNLNMEYEVNKNEIETIKNYIRSKF